MKRMNGTYYEIIGGMEDDIITKDSNDRKAKFEAMNTERVAYRNTYKDGKRIESVKLYDPYDDEYFSVGTDTVYYEPISKDMEFMYQMLGRLRMDCEYFLGNGNGYEPHLWAGSVEKQIAEMRKRWREFKTEDKPEWLTWDDINKYEKEMLAKRRIA